ncbi:class I ribonucleotide reductase maintenance protein YfaE [Candidatus Ishikawella capsulata]|uniref:Predicted 2Fe-2S cluster-containing protein n=1 Tax=Candidatus Ishikawaella capsulata Mpkobe TaxID=476281 RepID=C5WC72_9ENTR|nr:class I ribonucleotide reductase maintenance protein YfaE [Candidatus Ishikawaella capsulata]BAH82928.1 predicted 2Fe-2S cluster-containing protein [Candidatus Ishikawaella capsulata Mpkobe]
MKKNIITIANSGYVLEYNKKHSNLLSVLESHNFLITYNCLEGYCGCCKIRLLKGEVHYTKIPIAYVEPGEILPCCCCVIGDIEIAL